MGEEKKAEDEKPKAAAAEDEKPKAEDEKPKSGVAEEPKKEGEKKDGDAPAAESPPPPPEEVEMRVFMHCEGCARKVKRSLKCFDGVEEVRTDCRTHKVVVKGRKAAEDPMKVVERVQKKTGRKVELLTPLPPPKAEEKKDEETKKEEEKPKVEEKKEEPVVMVVVLKVHMHCEACAQEIKKRISRMKGVQSVESDLKSSEVTVKGIFDPPKLVEYVHKRTGKHALVVKAEPADKKTPAAEDDKAKDVDKAKDEKKSGGDDKGEGEKAEKASDEKSKEAASPEEAATAAAVAAAAKLEQRRNEFYYYYPSVPRYPVEYAAAYGPYQQVVYAPPQPQMAYPPQMFSDENPNACSVM